MARVVTHGTKAMLALPGRTYDLCGEGWQQEHWCFAVRRGYGLNRNWLPWVSVAHIEGILRLEDIGALLALMPTCMLRFKKISCDRRQAEGPSHPQRL